MRPRFLALTSLSGPLAWLVAGVVLMPLAACGGNGSGAAAAAAPSTPPVITQSTITLPSSVQVVSAK
jgi:hypothetical protein